MREILSRGKWIDNEEWMEGYYAHIRDDFKRRESHRIYSGTAESDCGEFYEDWFEVDPSTVGEYTGLTDKNEKKIFEGDIVEIDGKRYEVKYMLGQFFVGINTPIAYKRFDCEVIGNIYDNPELLQEVQV